MTMPSLDPRRHPMRPDLAAEYLRGQVTAERFVAGREMRIAEPVVDLRSRPSPDAGVETQALFGEIFIAYEDQEGWVWGQLKRDGYVGYMSANGLVVGESVATHKLTVPRSFVYPGLSMKLPIVCALSLGSELKVTKQHGDFVEVEHLGCLWAGGGHGWYHRPCRAARSGCVRFCQHCRNVSSCALSLGRQIRSGTRLFGPHPNQFAGSGHCSAARYRYAMGRVRSGDCAW